MKYCKAEGILNIYCSLLGGVLLLCTNGIHGLTNLWKHTVQQKRANEGRSMLLDKILILIIVQKVAADFEPSLCCVRVSTGLLSWEKRVMEMEGGLARRFFWWC